MSSTYRNLNEKTNFNTSHMPATVLQHIIVEIADNYYGYNYDGYLTWLHIAIDTCVIQF